MACPSLLIPTGLLVISLGLTIVLALHAHRPRLTTVGPHALRSTSASHSRSPSSTGRTVRSEFMPRI